MSTVRVAMWSGPRNISTAMMRSFSARADAIVVDEPLYAFYLAHTDLDHPGREDILAAQPQDWATVVRQLTIEPLPEGRTVYYQKHMTHHMLPEVDRAALATLTHAFLIREPREVLRSYARVRGEPTLADLGFPQQVELFERFGGPVLDARDVLADPASMLSALCLAVGIPWDPAMLSWPAGPHPSDGVWAPHWYAAVEASTGFAAPASGVPAEGSGTSDDLPPLDSRLEPLLERCRPYYDALAAHRLRAH